MISSNITLEQAYNLLRLNPSASIDEIKASYRQMAKSMHPDLNPEDPTARDRFNTLNQAYQLLLVAARTTTDNLNKNTATNVDSQDRATSVRVSYVIEPISPADLQLKQEIFESLEKLMRQDNFTKAVSTIDLLVKVIPNCQEISRKQSEVYFKYAQDLVKQRTQLHLARTYLKASLKIDPHNQQRWEAVNREFNQIERLTK
ncbi:J domain-containing protein [Chamaesiphon sp. GL140_3_metabinner_50]|uniref:J domain-containing protein n=1 Tax=Chamaesiphon sp. GL140_3_metabinner_50 TaxID=2970812 RepID=UPI0025E7E63C|nr:J domain-containing protein [Chamaesiphon sp. GL140_3_metabinner_50]